MTFRAPLALTLCAAALSVHAGCDDAPKAPTTPDPSAVVRSQPASDALQKALVSTWVLDLEALAKDPSIVKLPPDAQAQALRIAGQLMAGTQVTFGDAGALTMVFGKRSQSGRYTVTSAAGDTLTLKAETEGVQGKKTETIKVTLTGDRLRLTGEDGKSLDLVRQGSTAETSRPAPAPADTAPTGAAPASAVTSTAPANTAPTSQAPASAAPAPATP